MTTAYVELTTDVERAMCQFKVCSISVNRPVTV